MARDIDDLLPLRPAHYLILLSLAEGELHGYGLKKAIVRRTDGRVDLGAGSLYRSLHQLVERRLIEPSDRAPDPVLDDERRSYFRITELGRAVAIAETERLAALVADARSMGLEA